MHESRRQLGQDKGGWVGDLPAVAYRVLAEMGRLLMDIKEEASIVVDKT